MKEIKIGSRIVGSGHPSFIIAEIGLNHNGDIKIAKELIDVAVDAKVDAVKLQKRNVQRILTKDFFNSIYLNNGNSFGKTYGEHRLKLELKESDYIELANYAREKGILFFASAWDEESADFLDSLNLQVFKIGSPDLTNLPLCVHVAKKTKPVIVSTGMSYMWEIEQVINTMSKFNDQLVIMHCVSIYPTPYEKVNLGFMKVLQACFDYPVGYSGHELGIEIPVGAVAMGATCIEKHITLSRTMKGGDHKFSLEPNELKAMVNAIRNMEKAMIESGKTLLDEEMPFRQKLSKSLVINRDLPKGTVITNDVISCKSPQTGISPLMISKIIGKKLGKDLKEDQTLTQEYLE